MSNLSTEQSEILRPGIQLVEACPGAGKTRAVIERFKQSAKAHARKGVALVSFTNIASDTALSRCLGDASLFKPPHFIGTFDTFLHRYILTPSITPIIGRAPTYLSSWRDFQYDNQHILRVASYPGKGISIDSFIKTVGGEIVINEDGLKDEDRRYLDNIKLSNIGDYGGLLSRCINKINQYNNNGVYDSDTARYKALSLLESEEVVAKLALRFNEIIVDEFQDCSAIEHAILAKFKQAGIHILVVADADQAIFEFRNASPQTYQDYRATLDQDKIIQFKDNYRSSQPICDIVSSLRPSTNILIESKISQEDAANCASNIYVLSATSLSQARVRAVELIRQCGLNNDDLMVLGRTKSDARDLAGDRSSNTKSAKLVVRILMTLHIIKDGSISTREKMRSLRSVERSLLDLFNWPNGVDISSTANMYEAIGKTPLWTRRVISRIGQAGDNLWSSKDECLQIVRSILTEEYNTIDIPRVSTINRRAQLTQDDWVKCRQHFHEATANGTLKWSSIHGAKGAEYQGVLIYAPSDIVIQNWSNDINTEERRVFYVAASRARKILMIHIQRRREAELTGALMALGIPHDLHRC